MSKSSKRKKYNKNNKIKNERYNLLSDWQRDPAGVEVHLHGKAGPTREMRQHIDFEDVTLAIDGKPVKTRRTVDVLTALRKKKTITHAEEMAGRHLQRDVYRAGLPAIKASRLMWVPSAVSEADVCEMAAQARTAIKEAFDVLGGIGSRKGEVIWWCLVMECSLRDFERWQESLERKTGRDMACGLLCGALEMLAQLYGYEGRQKRC